MKPVCDGINSNYCFLGKQPCQKGNVRGDAGNFKTGKGAPELHQDRFARLGMRNQLGQHRVVMRRNGIPGREAGIDAQAARSFGVRKG